MRWHKDVPTQQYATHYRHQQFDCFCFLEIAGVGYLDESETNHIKTCRRRYRSRLLRVLIQLVSIHGVVNHQEKWSSAQTHNCELSSKAHNWWFLNIIKALPPFRGLRHATCFFGNALKFKMYRSTDTLFKKLVTFVHSKQEPTPFRVNNHTRQAQHRIQCSC